MIPTHYGKSKSPLGKYPQHDLGNKKDYISLCQRAMLVIALQIWETTSIWLAWVIQFNYGIWVRIVYLLLPLYVQMFKMFGAHLFVDSRSEEGSSLGWETFGCWIKSVPTYCACKYTQESLCSNICAQMWYCACRNVRSVMFWVDTKLTKGRAFILVRLLMIILFCSA